MKNTYIYACLLFFSCDRLLDADLNKSEIVIQQVFNNDVTATAAMTAIYGTMSGGTPISVGGGSVGVNSLASLSANDFRNYGQEADLVSFENHSMRSQNTRIEGLWNSLYLLIYKTNAVLEGVQKSTSLSSATAKQLQGEARFTRAFFYFYLVNLFGDVPLATATDYRTNLSLARRPVDEVYALIISDLLAAQSLLSQDYVSENRARPNKATATALLARVYLYRKEYVQAEAETSSIITNSAYQLVAKDKIAKTFLIDSQETIWQLMSVLPDANTAEGYNFIQISTPSSGSCVITDGLRLHFESGDLRSGNWISSVTNAAGTVYFPYKYRQKLRNPTEAFNECSIVFRLAEMYLIRAEARTQIGKLIGANSALSDINTIRERAGLPASTVSDKESILLAIEKERWSELFIEYGHRWLDLNRTGRTIEVLGNGITQDDLLWPIPAAEFAKNPKLGSQNVGY